MNMNGLKYSKFITFLGVSGTCLLLSLYLLTLFDVIDLTFVADFETNRFIDLFLEYIVFIITIDFIFTFVLNYKNKIIYIVIYSVLVALFSLLITKESGMILSTILPIVFTFFIRKESNISFKKFVVRWIMFILFSAIIQPILLTIKSGSFNFSYYHDCNSMTMFIYSIDLILIYLFIGKVVIYNVVSKFSISTHSKSISKSRSETLNDLKKLSVKQLIFFYFLVIFYQLLQLLIVLLIGFINDMFIEILIMLPLFFLGKYMVGGVWHSETLSYCSLATFVGFYILTKVNFPLEISIFSTVFLSGVFVFILHKILEHIEELNLLRSWFTKEEQLKKKMYDCNISQIRQKIVIDKLINHKSSKEIAYEIGVTEKTVNNYYTETKRVLGINKKGQIND